MALDFWLDKLLKWARDYGWESSTLFFTFGAAVFSEFRSRESGSWVNKYGLAIFVALSLAGLGSGIMCLFSRKRQTVLEEENRQFQINTEDTQRAIDDICHWHLRDLSKSLDFTSRERATVYLYDQESKCFRPISRYCDDPLHETRDGERYAVKHGCIGKAWSDGDHFCVFELSRPPEDASKVEKKKWNKAWVEWCNAGYTIPKRVANRIRFKASLYFGWRLKDRNGNRKLAVLMIESLDPEKWDQETIKGKFVSKEERMFNDILDIIERRAPAADVAKKRGM